MRFLRSSTVDRPWWTLHGLAGTGKTHVLATLAHSLPNSLMCAFTGKAASVLRSRTGLNVSTVHSAIYHFTGMVDDDEGIKRPTFVNKDENYEGKVILLDECSTVGARLAEDLLATGARIIACGDPGQLPPVRDSAFFDEPNLTLVTVHRQALDSPIIRQAHAVRSGGSYKDDGENFRVVRKVEMTADDLVFGGIALVYRNETRRRLNSSRRRAIGIHGTTLRAGEPIMMLRNDHRLALYNGAIYTVAIDRPPGEDLQVIDDAGRRVTVVNPTVEMIDPEYDTHKNEEEWSPLTLAYAATVHKAQGSEWDEVLVVDEYDRDYQKIEFLYTAITRAAKKIVMVKT